MSIPGNMIRFDADHITDGAPSGVNKVALAVLEFALPLDDAWVYIPYDSKKVNGKEENLRVYRCVDWNFMKSSCSGNWERINREVHTIRDAVEFTTNKSAAFLVGENNWLILSKLDIKDLEVYMGESVVVEGAVVDNDDNPVEGAKITLSFPEFDYSKSAVSTGTGGFSARIDAPQTTGNILLNINAAKDPYSAVNDSRVVKVSRSEEMAIVGASDVISISLNESKPINLSIINSGQTNLTDRIYFEINGIPSDWYSITPPYVEGLEVDESTNVLLDFRVSTEMCLSGCKKFNLVNFVAKDQQLTRSISFTLEINQPDIPQTGNKTDDEGGGITGFISFPSFSMPSLSSYYVSLTLIVILLILVVNKKKTGEGLKKAGSFARTVKRKSISLKPALSKKTSLLKGSGISLNKGRSFNKKKKKPFRSNIMSSLQSAKTEATGSRRVLGDNILMAGPIQSVSFDKSKLEVKPNNGIVSSRAGKRSRRYLEKKHDDLIRKLKNASSRKEDLNNRLEYIKKSSYELTEEIKRIESKHSEHKSRIVSMEDEVDRLSHVIHLIDDELSGLESRKRSLVEQTNDLIDREESISGKKEHLMREKNDVMRSLEQLSSAKRSLSEELTSTEKESKKLSSELAKIEKQYNKHNNSVISMEDKVGQIDKDGYDTRLNMLQDELKQINKEIDSLNNQGVGIRKKKSNMLDSMKSLVNSKKDIISSRRDSSMRHMRFIEDLRNLAASGSKLDDIKSKNAEFTAEITRLEELNAREKQIDKRKNKLVGRVSAIKSEEKLILDKQKSLADKKNELIDSIDRINHMNDSMKSRIDYITSEQTALSDKLVSLNNGISDCDAEINSMDSKIKDYEDKVNQINLKEKSIEANKNKIRAQIDKLKSREKRLMEKKKPLLDRKNNLIERIDEFSKERDYLKLEQEAISSKQAKYESDLEKLHSEKSSFDSHIIDLRKQLSQLEQEIYDKPKPPGGGDESSWDSYWKNV